MDCFLKITWICWMSCTVERREMLELERKEDLRRCSLRARGPPPAQGRAHRQRLHANAKAGQSRRLLRYDKKA